MFPSIVMSPKSSLWDGVMYRLYVRYGDKPVRVIFKVSPSLTELGILKAAMPQLL